MRPYGFTLIELLVTMALAAVLLMLAVPGMQALMANQRLSSASSNLLASAMQARSTALKANQRVIVQPLDGTDSTDGDWSQGWRVYLDKTENSTFDSGTDTLVLTQEALPDGISVTKVTGTNNFFGYNGTGFLASIGGSANATWKLTSSATDREKYLVIERTGRARVCDPKVVANCPS